MGLGSQDTVSFYKNGFEENDRIFYPNEEQKQRLQAVLLEMTKDVISVFQNNEIQYSLGGGSVLGAVRHRGFIPWDDDIDLNISRREYKKFLRIFERELGDRYMLCAPETEGAYALAHTQIKKKGTICRSFNELALPQAECGIAIDLFVCENTYSSSFLRKLHGIRCLGYGYLLTCRRTYRDWERLLPYLEEGSRLYLAYEKKKRIGSLVRFLNLKKLQKRTAKVYASCRNDATQYVTFPTGRRHFFGEIGKRSDLLHTKEVEFEDITVCIPKGYDTYLSHLYGDDYMKIPDDAHHERHPMMELDFGTDHAG